MGKRRRAYIHIGLAKTGTTSIQNAFAADRRQLLSDGYLYPESGTLNKLSGHHCLAWSIRGTPRLHLLCRQFQMQSFRDAVAEARDFDVVVSSEEFSSMSYNVKMIRQLLSLFGDHEVYVVAYVREQAEFFNAFWAELVSDLSHQSDLDEFVHKCLGEKRYHYSNWFGTWQRLVGPRLIVRPFDRAFLTNGDVVDDFCNVIGTSSARLPSLGARAWKNQALNTKQIAAVVGLAKRLVSMGLAPDCVTGPRRMQLKRIVARLAKDEGLADGEVFWGIKPELVQQVRKEYGESNRGFFRDFLTDDFVFSAVDEIKSSTLMEYEDLDWQLRTRLESKLADELSSLDVSVSP